MPFVEVKLLAGRTREQKAELARRLTDDIVDVFRCESEQVNVVFTDIEKADWAVAGELTDRPSSSL